MHYCSVGQILECVSLFNGIAIVILSLALLLIYVSLARRVRRRATAAWPRST